MKNATSPTFRTPELLKWTFVGLILLPIGMMAHNAYVFLEGENLVLGDENLVLAAEVAQLEVSNLELGVTVDELEGDLVDAKLENQRLLLAKSELVEDLSAVRIQIGYHESREDSLQRVIDLLKNEIVANERKIVALREENLIAAQTFRRMGASEMAESGNGISPEIAEQNYFELVKSNQALVQQTQANDRQALELLSEISELNTELEQFKGSRDAMKGKVALLNQELLEKRALIDAIAVRQSN